MDGQHHQPSSSLCGCVFPRPPRCVTVDRGGVTRYLELASAVTRVVWCVSAVWWCRRKEGPHAGLIEDLQVLQS